MILFSSAWSNATLTLPVRSWRQIARAIDMQFPPLTPQQKDMVWRYAHCAALWRRMGHSRNRSFASLESDMAAGNEILADGIAIDGRPGYPVVIGDAKDPEFFAAIFRNDNR